MFYEGDAAIRRAGDDGNLITIPRLGYLFAVSHIVLHMNLKYFLIYFHATHAGCELDVISAAANVIEILCFSKLITDFYLGVILSFV